MCKVSLLSVNEDNRHALATILKGQDVDLTFMSPNDFDSHRFHRFDADVIVLDLSCEHICAHPNLIEQVAELPATIFLEETIRELDSPRARSLIAQLVDKISSLSVRGAEPSILTKVVARTWFVIAGKGSTHALVDLFKQVTFNDQDRFIVAHAGVGEHLRSTKYLLAGVLESRSAVICKDKQIYTSGSVFILPSDQIITDELTPLFLTTKPEKSNSSIIQSYSIICEKFGRENVGVIVLSGNDETLGLKVGRESQLLASLLVWNPASAPLPSMANSALQYRSFVKSKSLDEIAASINVCVLHTPIESIGANELAPAA